MDLREGSISNENKATREIWHYPLYHASLVCDGMVDTEDDAAPEGWAVTEAKHTRLITAARLRFKSKCFFFSFFLTDNRFTGHKVVIKVTQ